MTRLNEQTKRILRELDSGNVRGKYHIIKLDCGHSIELTHTGDQLVTCPVCFKNHAVIWSMHPKLQWSGNGRVKAKNL